MSTDATRKNDSDGIKSPLPQGWDYPKLKELATIKYGKNLPTKNLAESGYPVFGANGIIGYYERYLYEEPQVLISCRGAYSGKINWSLGTCFVTNNSLVLEVPKGQEDLKKYLFYALQAIDKSKLVSGTAQPQVTINNAEVLQIPLAPKNQRKAIVAEIEKQFSRLDEAVANLKRVKANLKRYKAAVLKAAVEGKLTEDWRKTHPDVEPASELLKRILAERRARWNSKGKYKDPTTPDTSTLPELPKGWCWVALESISEALGGFAFESRKFSTSGYQVLKMANIRMGQIDISQKPSYIEDVDPETVSKYELKDGDLVVTLTGTRKKRDYGYIAVVKTLKRLLLNQRIARLRPFAGVLPDYLLIAMQSDTYRNRFFASETGNVGQGNVGMTAVTKEPVALAPVAEQEQIVAEAERQLSVMDETDAIIGANLQRADRLRQATLKKAFSGNMC